MYTITSYYSDNTRIGILNLPIEVHVLSVNFDIYHSGDSTAAKIQNWRQSYRISERYETNLFLRCWVFEPRPPIRTRLHRPLGDLIAFSTECPFLRTPGHVQLVCFFIPSEKVDLHIQATYVHPKDQPEILKIS